jgi:hypothetical protein
MTMLKTARTALAIYGAFVLFIISDCAWAWSAPLNHMITPTPTDGGWTSTATLFYIMAATVTALIIGLTAIRFITWVLFAKTGWLGRELGRAIIRGILEVTGTRGRNWRRDWIVRTIYKDVSGKQLKTLGVIRRHCMTARQIDELTAANDNRKRGRKAA